MGCFLKYRPEGISHTSSAHSLPADTPLPAQLHPGHRSSTPLGARPCGTPAAQQATTSPCSSSHWRSNTRRHPHSSTAYPHCHSSSSTCSRRQCPRRQCPRHRSTCILHRPPRSSNGAPTSSQAKFSCSTNSSCSCSLFRACCAMLPLTCPHSLLPGHHFQLFHSCLPSTCYTFCASMCNILQSLYACAPVKHIC